MNILYLFNEITKNTFNNLNKFCLYKYTYPVFWYFNVRLTYKQYQGSRVLQRCSQLTTAGAETMSRLGGGGYVGGRVIGANGPARSFYCKKTTSGRLHSWPTRCPKLA